MAYYIDLFSPETYSAFTTSPQNVSGFRMRQQHIASTIKPGDKFVCYMTKLSRWVGILEVDSEYFLDDKPIFLPTADPFQVRFRVRPKVWLSPEKSIPIRHDICWKQLSFTKSFNRNSSYWTGTLRSSLRKLSEEDGKYLEDLLSKQQERLREYTLSDTDRKNYSHHLLIQNLGWFLSQFRMMKRMQFIILHQKLNMSECRQ